MLAAPIELVEELMRTNTALARDLGRALDIRTTSQIAAWTAVTRGQRPTPELSSFDVTRPG